MVSSKKNILTINGGSSSIRFAFYQSDEAFTLLLSGKLENTGGKTADLLLTNTASDKPEKVKVHENIYEYAANFLIEWLERRHEFSNISAIGHRIVHGMQHTEPQEITSELVDT